MTDAAMFPFIDRTFLRIDWWIWNRPKTVITVTVAAAVAAIGALLVAASWVDHLIW